MSEEIIWREKKGIDRFQPKPHNTTQNKTKQKTTFSNARNGIIYLCLWVGFEWIISLRLPPSISIRWWHLRSKKFQIQFSSFFFGLILNFFEHLKLYIFCYIPSRYTHSTCEENLNGFFDIPQSNKFRKQWKLCRNPNENSLYIESSWPGLAWSSPNRQ